MSAIRPDRPDPSRLGGLDAAEALQGRDLGAPGCAPGLDDRAGSMAVMTQRAPSGALAVAALQARLLGAMSMPKDYLSLDEWYGDMPPETRVLDERIDIANAALEAMLGESVYGAAGVADPLAELDRLATELVRTLGALVGLLAMRSLDLDALASLADEADSRFLDYASGRDPSARDVMSRQYGRSMDGGGAFGNALADRVGDPIARGPTTVGGAPPGAPPAANRSAVASRVLDIARGELGVREATGNNDGVPAQRYSNGQNEPWCANFVSWTFRQAGLDLPGNQDAIGSCDTMARELASRGALFRKGEGTPQPGDIIFFGVPGDLTHVGIVQRVENGQVYTVEGNSGNRVAERSYPLDSPRIMSYGRWPAGGDGGGAGPAGRGGADMRQVDARQVDMRRQAGTGGTGGTGGAGGTSGMGGPSGTGGGGMATRTGGSRRVDGPAPNAPAGAPTGVGAGGGPSAVADRIIDRTAQFESGRRYDAWNPDDNGHGVSFGLIQFNQQVGGLPSLLRRMSERNPARFNEIFGPYASNLRSASYVRNADLNDPDLRARLQRAGRDPELQQVQRDIAREQYYDPSARLASQFGLRSERALAMLFDSSVQNGVGGTQRFLRQAAAGGGDERAILERFASLADRGRRGRRTRLLNEPSFSDGPPGGGAGGGAGTGPNAAAPATARADVRQAATPGADAVDAARAAPAVAAAQRTQAAGPIGRAGPIGPGTRVLMIGDSHTVGTYGQEMDRLLRSTGASVESYGSSGSSPSWWLRGTTTRSGFVARHADGRVEQPADWRAPTATPRLAELIRQQRPDVLVVSLGGNMRGLGPEAVRRQVSELAEVARANGTRLVWVGPPSRREDTGNRADIERFDRSLRDAVAPYGAYVASSPYTEYAGGDGIHYSGARGARVARDWAQRVFEEIQSPA